MAETLPKTVPTWLVVVLLLGGSGSVSAFANYFGTAVAEQPDCCAKLDKLQEDITQLKIDVGTLVNEHRGSNP